VRGALAVALGILASRLSGLVRQRVFGAYFGTSLWADAFNAGLRVPNLLQNLLGEGTLSASFIPVYAELVAQGRREEAGRVAGAIAALLAGLAIGLSALGVLAAPALVDLLAPGFTGERRDATVEVVRVLFPMTGALVLSAWSLGVLNSHRRFLTSYLAPVVWNVSIIVAFVVGGGVLGWTDRRLLVAVAWAALGGGVLQFAVQLPELLRVERALRLRWDWQLPGVREAVANAGPAVLGRGVVQLSGYLDMLLASLLAVGAVSTLQFAQTLYLLPVSLFGMSVAAAELPEMARARLDASAVLAARSVASQGRVLFFVVPTAVAFLVHGGALVGALFEGGAFGPDDTLRVWVALAGYAVGLAATTCGRVLSSALYALRDTRTPARLAGMRVGVAAVGGLCGMLAFEPIPSLGWTAAPAAAVRVGGMPLGAAGLTLGAGLAAWFEYAALRVALARRLGAPVSPGIEAIAPLIGSALLAAAVGAAADRVAWPHPALRGVAVGGAFGGTYLLSAWAVGVADARDLWTRVRRRISRR